MKRLRSAPVSLLVAASVCGCARREAPAPSAPSFRREIVPVLDRHCASTKGCHGVDPTDSVSLDLRAAGAYRQLVNQAAEARAGAFRVKPGEPAASFLVDKLTGTLGPREGKSMPIDAQTGAPILPSPLPPGFIDHVLKPWIAAGARDQ